MKKYIFYFLFVIFFVFNSISTYSDYCGYNKYGNYYCSYDDGSYEYWNDQTIGNPYKGLEYYNSNGTNGDSSTNEIADKYCKALYGDHSYWDGTVCNCYSGYPFNSITKYCGIKTCGVNAYLSIIGICYCNNGYKFNSNLGECEKYYTPTQICNSKYGINSYGIVDGGDCYCNVGYEWNTNKTLCVTPIELCQSSYGKYSTTDGIKNSLGKYNCYCIEGYKWNDKETSCIQKTNDDICHEKYGDNSSRIGNGCYCKTGYELNSNNSTCIKLTDEVCKEKLGIYGHLNGTNCECLNGYKWSIKKGTCIKLTDEICKEKLGIYGHLNGTNCECLNGYMDIGVCVEINAYNQLITNINNGKLYFSEGRQKLLQEIIAYIYFTDGSPNEYDVNEAIKFLGYKTKLSDDEIKYIYDIYAYQRDYSKISKGIEDCISGGLYNIEKCSSFIDFWNKYSSNFEDDSLYTKEKYLDLKKNTELFIDGIKNNNLLKSGIENIDKKLLENTKSGETFNNKYLKYANYLAKQGIIVDNSSYPDGYMLNSNITRGELSKIVLKMSETSVEDKCNNIFKDLNSSDWECKYAENGLNKGFFSKNEKFRPKDNITKIEALKMVMNSRSIQKGNNNDWKQAYIEGALKSGIIDSTFSDYDSYASRGWIFYVSYNAIGGNKSSTEEEDDNSSLLDDLLGN